MKKKININDRIRKICACLNPDRTKIIIIASIALFGIAFLGITTSSLFQLDKKDANHSLKIEHIDAIPLYAPNDTLTLKLQKDGKG